MPNYAEIVATGAALAAAGSLFLHWLRWKEDQRSKSLIVKFEVGAPLEGLPEWKALQVTMRSRSNLGYVAETLQVIWPPSGRLATIESTYSQDPGSGGSVITHPPEKPTMRLPMNLSVAHSGKSSRQQSWGGTAMGSGDEHSADLCLKRRGYGRVLVLLRVRTEDGIDVSRHTKWLRFARV